jgi:hypothetical protein
VIAQEINVLQRSKGLIAEAEIYKKSIAEKKSAIKELYLLMRIKFVTLFMEF